MNDIVIKPKSKFELININEIWRFRELFYIFAWRDIKVRYKQTVLGILWVIFQPLIAMFLFTFIFGRFFTTSSTKLPYALFALCGLVFWNFFSNSLTHASNSLTSNENIIKKVYFPKIVLPLSTIATGFVDFFINFILLLVVTFFFGFIPSIISFFIIPLNVFITALTIAGLGLMFSSLKVKYRDVGYILPFFIQLFLFLSPIIYPTSILSMKYKFLLALNPLTGVVESTRIIMSGSSQIDFFLLGNSLALSLALFIVGLFVFSSTEKYLADIL
jgi:lipopolysaccharide transport system permease protein